MPPKRRKGAYKKYLRNWDVPVPRTTAWERQQELDRNREPNLDLNDAQAEGAIDPNAREGSPSSASSRAGSHSDWEPMNVESDDHLSQLSDSETTRPNTASGRSRDDTASHSGADAPLSEDESVISDSDNESAFDFANNDMHYFPINDEAIMIPETREPLYPGAQITAEESDVLIKSFIVRWNLKDKAVQHLLRLLDCHMPTPKLGSQYCFLKKFPIGPSQQLRYFCPGCSVILPAKIQDNFECDCGHLCSLTELKSDGRLFVQLSIAEQIQQVMCKEKVVKYLRKECEETDVISGIYYKRLRERNLIGDHDISLQWNTDGVSPCKTSKVTMYPIYASINELPYNIRKDNMMLCGLYYGKKKPDLNVILKPFVDELNLLREEGVQCTLPGREMPLTITVHTLLCSVDSVARAPLQGIMAHNGRHGCSFCLRRGRRVERGRDFARVYVGGHVGLPRDARQHVQALDALENYNESHRKKKKHVEGVTTKSILLSLSGFNIIKSFVPDYMHLVLEGVVKTFWSHWTSSEYSDEPWYLTKAKREQLSEKLVTYKPPIEIARAPRSIEEICYWRAHDLKNFLLYYSLVSLKGILPRKYLRHWLLLVFSMTVFLKQKITREDFGKARIALIRFVEDISVLYPECYSLYTFNNHMLLHIPSAVKNFGALWASSTFPYENCNGVLTRVIRGSQGIPLQICTSFLRMRHVNEIAFEVFNRNNSARSGKELLDSMLVKSNVTRRSYQCAGGLTRYFGGPENYTLSLIEKASLQELLQEDVDTNAFSYQRMIVNCTVYHAESSGSLKVRNNSFSRLKNGDLVVISKILLVKLSNSGDVKSVCIGKLLQRFDENLCQYAELAISSSDIMYTCHGNERLISILPQSVDVKCVGVPYGNSFCVIPLANTIETE